MKTEDMKQELIDTYQNFYVEGFKTNNVSLIDQIVVYPIAYIKQGSVAMLDHFPVNPVKLKAEIEWDHSKDWNFDIPAITKDHAHVVASATRCRKDGSVIERVHGFYAFKKINGIWKIYALADQVF